MQVMRAMLVLLAFIAVAVQAWNQTVPNGNFNNGAVDSGDAGFGIVVIASEFQNQNFGDNHTIQVVDATTGVSMHNFTTSHQVSWIKVVSATSFMYLTWHDIRLVSLDGTPIWTAPAPGSNWMATPPPYLPTANRGYFFTGFGIYVVALDTGKAASYYQDALGYAITANPTFATIGTKHVALVATTGHLTAVDISQKDTTTVVYRVKVSMDLEAPLTVSGSTLYSAHYGLGLNSGYVLAFDVATGASLWSVSGNFNPADFGFKIAGVQAAIDASGKSFVAVIFGNHVYKLDGTTGAIVTKVAPANPNPTSLNNAPTLYPGPFNAMWSTWTLAHPRGDVYAFNTTTFAFTGESVRAAGEGFGQSQPVIPIFLETPMAVYVGFNAHLVKVNKASGARTDVAVGSPIVGLGINTVNGAVLWVGSFSFGQLSS